MQGVSTNQREIVVGAVGLAPSSASTQIGNALKLPLGVGARVLSFYLILTFSLILLTLILWGFYRSTVQFAANFILYILTTALAINMFAQPLLSWISQSSRPDYQIF